MDPNAFGAGIGRDIDSAFDSDSVIDAFDSDIDSDSVIDAFDSDSDSVIDIDIDIDGLSDVDGHSDVAIDCATCPVRAIACDDCVVSVLLGPPQFDQEAADALVVLADRGLVPPLRDPRESRSRTAG